MLTFNHRVDSTMQGATFGVTDGTSLIAKGVLTPRGSFWQKETFNANGNKRVRVQGNHHRQNRTTFDCQNAPPLPRTNFGKGRPLLATKCGLGGPVLDWTTFHMTNTQQYTIHNTIWKVSLIQQNRSTPYFTSCSANSLA